MDNRKKKDVKEKKKKEPTFQDKLKCEVAKELGLWSKVEQYGWGELNSEESGRIGGVMSKLLKEKGVGQK